MGMFVMEVDTAKDNHENWCNQRNCNKQEDNINDLTQLDLSCKTKNGEALSRPTTSSSEDGGSS